MIKLVCYGVRETEVKYFEEINKKFGYDIKLVTLGLNHENVKEAIGAEAVMVRGNCKADRQNLELLKANGLKYLLTRTVGFDHVDLEAVKEELADVMNYCIQMSQVLNVDIIDIINAKMDKTEKKYPVDKAKGVSTKYNKL